MVSELHGGRLRACLPSAPDQEPLDAGSGLRAADGGAVPVTIVTYTHWRRVEVHPRVAMRILWHAQIDMTMSVHAEVSDARARQALRWLGKQLRS
jgi:hypothetical protein